MTTTQIQSLITKACSDNNVQELSKKIKFSFQKNMTRCFGLAYTSQKRIKFSVPLWERASEEERKQVVVHEACHIIATHKYGENIKPHGEEWKECMTNAGYPAQLYHFIDRTGLRKFYKKFEASCDCSSVWTSHVKAAKVRKKKIICRRCKSKIKLTGNFYIPEEG